MASNPQAGSSKISSTNFNDFNNGLQVAALKSTRHALGLPSDLGFHRSMDPDLSKDLDAFSARVLSVTNTLLNLASTSDSSKGSRGKGKIKLEDEDDVMDSFQSLIVDTMDQLLERADICLDDHLGHNKAPAVAVNPAAVPTPAKKSNVPRGRLDPALQHASHLPKPQLKFKRRIDNHDRSPWLPTLSHKYNAQVPLGYNYRETDGMVSTSTHPYQYEIKHITYPERMFQTATPIPAKPFEETPFSWVSTPSEFAIMLDKLRPAKELAVDLEHHSFRTWSGFLCLMQISTREEDFVVDTLALREELFELNEVFTDPRIVKVFHGAESDIVWLQQDLNIYIVNLFDTYHASRMLEFSRHGLLNLLEAYCDYTPDKRYQLADWRIRPLPEEMLLYARSDTHFLLFIYDNLRNALLDRAQTSPPETPSPPSSSSDPAHALVHEVLARSEITALRVYEKEFPDEEEGSGPGGWDTLAKKWNKGSLMRDALPSLQRELYRRLHGWRDRVARDEDESRMYVLSNNYLFQLAERPPVDMAALLAAFKSMPPVARRRAKELFDLIQSCVQEYKSTERADANEPLAVAVAPDSALQAESMEKEVVKPVGGADNLNLRLWAKAHNAQPATASSSSLFGSLLGTSNHSKAPASGYSASTSALFARNTFSPPSAHADISNFTTLVSRIHSTLVIAPSAPKANPDQDPKPSAPADVVMSEEQADTTERAYVPLAQRQPVDVIDDSIVVVGQARQKKRKRTKPSAQDNDSPGKANGEGVERKGNSKKQKQLLDADADDSPEPFDYSKVPNILDDVPIPEPDPTKRKKKKQKQNQGGVVYGDFSAPPKAHRETKSGNQSFTFK